MPVPGPPIPVGPVRLGTPHGMPSGRCREGRPPCPRPLPPPGRARILAAGRPASPVGCSRVLPIRAGRAPARGAPGRTPSLPPAGPPRRARPVRAPATPETAPAGTPLTRHVRPRRNHRGFGPRPPAVRRPM